MTAYKSYPQVSLLCTMIQSRDLIYNNRVVVRVEQSTNSTEAITLHYIDGTSEELAKLIVNATDFKFL